ncbi:Regulator of chromosome condensation (RCC1) family protein [Arabidopsis thaliana]|uniref:Regulator of chromosome condensation (RCC1) family protein n=1 Tax=Arabidopsis thaliana TaxID=3702 RepID=A0A1I9LLL7_ARATH|nr:Regulator of chromosome condensation (RCC1) family protein [Arabidopsis thaliana]ANM63475.1 Regulator of chromosome condensation (RCC1) family protein [Arabidopsis thaliana]|eukprot:NP_001325561.1 Regulator of chromosome condensation (RCC1) family protein [Arabidopsis thaliana]
MACFQRSVPTDRENEQAIAILKKGAYLLKYGRRGKPKFYPFRLSSDEIYLLWYCGKKEKRLKLSSVTRIIPGQRTAVFRRYPQPTKEYQSFSLIYGERSLDLVCKDKDEAEFWLTTLRALLSRNNSSALVLHSRSRSLAPENGEQSSSSQNSKSNIRSVSSDTSYEEHAKKASGSHCNTPQRLGKVFSEVLSQTAVLKALSLDELVHKPHTSPPETIENRPTNHSSPGVDTSKYSISSAVSSSSQGSTFEDLKSLCDVFVWGESIGDGLLGGGMHKSGSSSSLMTDSFLPKVLKSHVALDAQSISCGTNYAVLVTKQGQMYSWGEESGGRLGHGVCSYVPHPKLIDEFNGSTVELADCGEFHTCAVTASGDLYAWGDGDHNAGLLGLGSGASHWKPVRILGQMEGIYVKAISCGPWHTAFVTSEGKLFTFGDGTFGALGHGDRISTNIPREVEALNGCRTIKAACGVWHSAAVVSVFGEATSSGKLFTWGDGDDGRLGHGDIECRLIPSCVTELDTTSFQQVACGQSITVALSMSGQVYAMGTADPSHDIVRAPSCIEGGLGKSFVQEVACGFHHIAVLNSKAEVYTWGKGSNGQLGHGDTEYRCMPTLVKALKGKQVRKVVCGSNYTATICLHKPITGTDSTKCSGCRHPFNYMRKLHNCYNCGSVFCNSCTSKKSLAAAMAPKTNRPYRVCDDCYIKLEGIRESLATPANSARFSNASLPSSYEMDEIGITPQRQLLRVDSFDFFRQTKHADLKTIGETSGGSCTSSIHSNMDIKGSFNLKGIRRLSRLTSFDSVQEEGKQRTKHCASKSDTSSLIRHSVTCGLPFSRRGSVELFPLSIKSSPVESVATTSDFTTDITDHELLQEVPKKSNQCLSHEISVLKAQVEELTLKSKKLETELGKTSKKLEVAVLMARDDAEKIKSSEEIVRSLTLQLMNTTKKEVDKTRRHRNSF